MHDLNLQVMFLILVAQLGAVAGIVAILWAKDRWWDRGHDCMLVPVQVDHDRSFGAAMGGGRQFTRILWRCQFCADVTSTTVQGVFSLADVRAWGNGPMPHGWEPRIPVAALTAGTTP